MAGVRTTISGRVQGVGFRSFVKSEAERQGIVGEVWNRSDGRVEFVAFHADPNILTNLVDQLWHGPGDVEDVQTETIQDRYDLSRFEIVSSRLAG